MKTGKALYCGLLALLMAFSAAGQSVERVYVATDRNVYLAGERIACSLFSLDAEGRRSGQSAVAYMELIGSDGTAVEAKAGLLDGRGGGFLTLPSSLPTGNYRLVAYTATGSVSPSGSRIISVYNPFSLRRTGNTGIAESYAPAVVNSVDDPLLEVVPTRSGMRIRAAEAMSVCVSVFRADSLMQAPLPSIREFMEAQETLPGGETEYDGEIIRGRVSGAAEGMLAFLSTSGSPADTYVSTVDADGTLRFPTGNIYGDCELVCEVVGGSADSFIIFESPFLHPDAEPVPSLQLSPVQEHSLLERKKSLEKGVRVDTLMQLLPRRTELLPEGLDWNVYRLDEYNRFPTVREVIREILAEVRLVHTGGEYEIRLLSSDASNARSISRDHILTMMDGVIVTDINLLLRFDAMLLDRVEVAVSPFVIGRTPFEGLVNFVTKNNYVTSLAFPDRVRVVDFRGVSYPVALTTTANQDYYTRYWHPMITLESGEEKEIAYSTRFESGEWYIHIEGISENGAAVQIIKLIAKK